ncbi:hypothetical protein C1645_875752 [Glomus cerebriforme]|uniref:MARVEL domain-containing protein n=1 Tax=Glomus cerebriforme TaxID=658196 RepID=A0A397T273_9GLOM|nr:hypothetical protein C1645_875752 [Glomus cerebriforme]
MTLYGYFRTCVIGCLGFPLALLILLCPALDIAKIIIFNHTNGELKLYDIEYAYLSYSFLMVVILFCCTLCIARGHDTAAENSVRSLSCFLPFIWIAVLVIYTISTRNEIGDIPFTCPSNYNYTSTTVHLACQIRTANIICMWSFTILITLFLLILLALPSEKSKAEKVYERMDKVHRKDDKADKDDKDHKDDKEVKEVKSNV